VANLSRSARLFLISFAIVIALTGALDCQAQSGRRPRKPATPTVEPAAPVETVKAIEPQKPLLPIVVTVDRYNGFSTIPLTFYDAVIRGCTEILNQGPGVKVEPAKEMSRSDAVLRAKEAKDGYVVWLQIKVESLYGDPTIIYDLRQLYIEYSVFEAKTARRAAFGHGYQGGVKKGSVVVQPPGRSRTNSAYTEYALREAAKDAAGRILVALKIRQGLAAPQGGN
jgi:hypothetical protein